MRNRDELQDVKLPNGNVLQFYEPPASGQGGMQSGKCPGCRNGLHGYRGRCACIRELDMLIGEPVVGSYTTSYGHLDCVSELFRSVANSIEEPTASPSVVIWKYGTQREAILYVQGRGLEGKPCVVEFLAEAARDQRYRFRTVQEETT